VTTGATLGVQRHRRRLRGQHGRYRLDQLIAQVVLAQKALEVVSMVQADQTTVAHIQETTGECTRVTVARLAALVPVGVQIGARGRHAEREC
jgi:hypothetical protein